MKKLVLLSTLVTSLVSLNAFNPQVDPQFANPQVDQLALDVARIVDSGNAMVIAQEIRRLDSEIELLKEKLEVAELARYKAEARVAAWATGVASAVATVAVVRVAHAHDMCTIL